MEFAALVFHYLEPITEEEDDTRAVIRFQDVANAICARAHGLSTERELREAAAHNAKFYRWQEELEAGMRALRPKRRR
jgi:hypothetical protein